MPSYLILLYFPMIIVLHLWSSSSTINFYLYFLCLSYLTIRNGKISILGIHNQIKELKSINLADNKTIFLSDLFHCLSLKEIHLKSNGLSFIDSNISNLKNLKFLDISQNNLCQYPLILDSLQYVISFYSSFFFSQYIIEVLM